MSKRKSTWRIEHVGYGDKPWQVSTLYRRNWIMRRSFASQPEALSYIRSYDAPTRFYYDERGFLMKAD